MTKEMQYPSCKVTVNYDFSITDKNGRHICTDQEGIQEVEIGFIPFEVIKRVSDFNDSLTERDQEPVGFYELQSLARQNPELIKELNKFIIGTEYHDLNLGLFNGMNCRIILPSKPSSVISGDNLNHIYDDKNQFIAPDSKLVAIVLNRKPLDQGKKPIGCSMADIYHALKSGSGDIILNHRTGFISTATELIFDDRISNYNWGCTIRNYPLREIQSEKRTPIPHDVSTKMKRNWNEPFGKILDKCRNEPPMLGDFFKEGRKSLEFLQVLFNTKDCGSDIKATLRRLFKDDYGSLVDYTKFIFPPREIKTPELRVSVSTDIFDGKSLKILFQDYTNKGKKYSPFELRGDPKGIYREPQQKRRKNK